MCLSSTNTDYSSLDRIPRGLTGIKTKVNQKKEQKSQTRTPPAGNPICCRERVSIHSSIAGTRRDVRNPSAAK